jgi:hypothetical protein
LVRFEHQRTVHLHRQISNVIVVRTARSIDRRTDSTS